MKRILITLMILGLACTTTQAQSILRRLERTARTAAERAAERKVEEKVEEEVSKALDEALEESEKEKQEAGSDKNKEGRSSSRRAVQNQDLEFDDWDMEAEDLEMMKRIGRTVRTEGIQGLPETTILPNDRQDKHPGMLHAGHPIKTPVPVGSRIQTRDKTIPKTEGLRWNGPNPTLWPGMRSFLKTTWLGNSLVNFLPTGILLKEMQRLCVLTVKTPSCCSMMPG